MLEILLAFVMLFYAPIPLMVTLAHAMTLRKQKHTLILPFFAGVVLWSVLGVLMHAYFPLIFAQKFESLALRIIGGVLLIGAFLIEWQTRKQLGTSRLLGISELKRTKDKLITSGIYRYARHPRYVEHPSLFAGLGLLFGYTSLLWFALYLFSSFAIAAYFEENELLQRYGKTYDKYRKRTPAFFLRFGRLRLD